MAPLQALLIWFVLLGWLALVCVSDGRQRRIPNRLVLAGLAIGLAAHAAMPRGAGLFDGVQPGSVGLTNAALAVLLAGVIGLTLCRLHLFGGGDGKLLAAVAAFTGLAGVFPVLLLTLVAGGVLALGTMVMLSLRPTPAAVAPGERARLPYSWAIAVGTLVFAAHSAASRLTG